MANNGVADYTKRSPGARRRRDIDFEGHMQSGPSEFLLPTPPVFIPVDQGQKTLGESEKIFQTPCAAACGTYEKMHPPLFFGKNPERLPPSLRKDFHLCAEVYDHFGLMLRPQTLQLIRQLETYANQKDPCTGHYPAIAQRGFLLDGVQGAGKSICLQHLVWWAKTHGWIVLYESEPDQYMRRCTPIVRSNAGIYIQEEFSHQFLKTFVKANESKLGTLPVSLEAYGRIALDGSPTAWSRRVFEPTVKKSVRHQLRREVSEPTEGRSRSRNLEQCLERAQTVSVDLLKRQMLLEQQLRSLIHTPTVRQQLPRPQTVLEIAQLGVDDSAFSTAALAEVLQQLRLQTKIPVLIAVDNLNSLFWVSQYVSARYNLTKYNGYIPGVHLALPRLLSRWDGGGYKRGIKVGALTWSRNIKRRAFDPRLLGVSPTEVISIPQFSASEFDCYVRYMAHKSAVVQFPESKIPYYYMMTNGNGEKARKTLATFY